MTGSKDLTLEVMNSSTERDRDFVYLRDVKRKNKYSTTESDLKMFRVIIRPVMTYGAYSNVDTTRDLH